MEFLHRERKTVEGREVDFIFLEDADFKHVLDEKIPGFVKEHREQEHVLIALISYPSFNSLLPDEIKNYSINEIRNIYP